MNISTAAVVMLTGLFVYSAIILIGADIDHRCVRLLLVDHRGTRQETTSASGRSVPSDNSVCHLPDSSSYSM
jgi:hypothetical protein